ncbi:MAG: lysophospholipid acyltransferase family protein [Myxococcota bacterium]|nr:lysophospholipid acyltransferase family protein [Myxococcota bacterium]
MNVIVSGMIWTLIIGVSVLFYPIAAVIRLVTGPFDRRLWLLHRFTCFWAAIFSWGSPVWPTRVVGRERVDPNEAYVIVANHLSMLDIVVLFRLFIHFKWVSKIENFSIPFIGWNMRLNRYIPLKRGDRESVIEMLGLCREAIAAGSSIFMFPEGTRSDTGEMRPFKPGAFQVALEAKAPILPVVVEGTSHALPKKGLVLRGRHPVTITVLEPMPYASFQDETPESLADRTRTLIAANIGNKGPAAVE